MCIWKQLTSEQRVETTHGQNLLSACLKKPELVYQLPLFYVVRKLHFAATASSVWDNNKLTVIKRHFHWNQFSFLHIKCFFVIGLQIFLFLFLSYNFIWYYLTALQLITKFKLYCVIIIIFKYQSIW